MNKIQLSEYSYQLPESRIAKYPLLHRELSKLLIYQQGSLSQSIFKNIGSFLPVDTLLCYNNTKVVYARLEFFRKSGARIEILCLEPILPADYQLSFQETHTCVWKCMIGNKKKWKEKTLTLHFYENCEKHTLAAEILEDTQVKFTWTGEFTFAQILEYCGQVPLPPYLNRAAEEIDKATYQTIYSLHEGSVAAPTAGLHFTTEVLDSLQSAGIQTISLTLHVGAGTFLPVKVENALDHTMHTEHFIITVDLIKNLINKIDTIVAVGTTSARTLESIYWLGVLLENDEKINHVEQFVYLKYTRISVEKALTNLLVLMEKNGWRELKATTQIMIVPGYLFAVCKGLITNFHQPGSTLLLLIAAFIGKDEWKKIYDFALNNDFRFLSYGDSSLLFPAKE